MVVVGGRSRRRRMRHVFPFFKIIIIIRRRRVKDALWSYNQIVRFLSMASMRYSSVHMPRTLSILLRFRFVKQIVIGTFI